MGDRFKGLSEGSDLVLCWVEVGYLVVMVWVWVRSWGTHDASQGPHKYRSTSTCVNVHKAAEEAAEGNASV